MIPHADRRDESMAKAMLPKAVIDIAEPWTEISRELKGEPERVLKANLTDYTEHGCGIVYLVVRDRSESQTGAGIPCPFSP